MEHIAEHQKESREKKKGNLRKQFILYQNECFGPIYTCICCIRDLFRRSVEELKGDLKRKILDEKNMHSMLTFDESLIIKDEYQESSEQKKDSK